MTRLHLIGGDLDTVGGVSDYTSLLAGALSSRGVTTHIWDATLPGARQQIRVALMQEPAPVVVQYVPNAYGAKGANLLFCAWLLALSRQGHDVRVMFHEPYFYFSAHPLRSGLAAVQRLMAAILLRVGTVTYVSTDTWRAYLAPYAPRGKAFITLPIPSTVTRCANPPREREWRSKLLVDGTRFLVGHFGTFGQHVATSLSPILTTLLRERGDVTLVCVGRGAERFVESVRRSSPHESQRILATGALSSDEVAAVLRACEVLIQPYPDGVTMRRTSVMAGIANAVATVSSQGALTESAWADAGALSLAPAGDPGAHVQHISRLLDDEGLRRAQAHRGAEFYDTRCSIDVVVATLLGQPLAATA
jgi:glycosyltransferase involved in cell wall biosynthesis